MSIEKNGDKPIKWPIIYKEWIKLRLIVVVSAITMIAIAIFCVYNINRMVDLKGGDHVWVVIMQRDAIFTNFLYWIPLVIGIALAIFQFLPETTSSRLKLMLHLPCHNLKSIGAMIYFGQTLLLLMSAITLAIIYFGFKEVMAIELVKHIVLTMIPWFLTGMIAYTLTVFIFLEPTWSRRILYMIMTALIIRIFFISSQPEAYNSFIIPMIICLILWTALPMLSVLRFKSGKAS